MVSDTVRDVDRSPDTFTQVAKLIETTSQRPTPSSTAAAPVSRLNYIQGILVSKGISSGSTDVICHSWSCGTTKQYEPAWNAWRSWCDSRSVDLLQAPITVFVDFLHHIYAQGKCYSIP